MLLCILEVFNIYSDHTKVYRRNGKSLERVLLVKIKKIIRTNISLKTLNFPPIRCFVFIQQKKHDNLEIDKILRSGSKQRF